MKSVEFTRKKLYDLVWKSTFEKITKKYGISGSGIRLACEQMQIPLPTNSHWVCVRYNRPLHIKKLPENCTGNDTIEIIKKKFEINSKLATEASPLIRLTKEIENDPKAPLVVPITLVKPEKIILYTKKYLSKKDNYSSYQDDVYILSINVEKQSLDRALRFMDTLIKLLKYRGHSIKEGSYGRRTVAFVNGIEIRLYLREATRKIVSKKQNYDFEYVPTGELILQIGESYRHKEWRDNKSNHLEDILARIVAKLELDAASEKERQEKYLINKIARDKEEVIKKEFLVHQQKELSNFKKLLSNAERLDKTAKLRNYIKTVEENAFLTNSLNEELKNWIVWANDKVDWYDPLNGKKDDYLSDYNLEDLV
ncbi:hypothetical protein [Flavobacterium sp. LS1P3]|uniref:hypothetical protein n=1 Tax=Flavobacterium sp. LS1P3 TaxID=3401720 RepID=UPI003AB05EA4